MNLKIPQHEYERLQAHLALSVKISEQMHKRSSPGRPKINKAVEWKQAPRKTPYRSKEVRKDVDRVEGKWIQSMTRCQLHSRTGNVSLQTGLIVGRKVVTFSSPLCGVIISD